MNVRILLSFKYFSFRDEALRVCFAKQEREVLINLFMLFTYFKSKNRNFTTEK